MAAARWAPVVGLLLLLPLLPSASSSAVVLKLHGNVYPDGNYYVTMNIGEQATPYFLDIDTGSTLTWLECDAGHGSCETCNEVPHKLYQAKQSKFVPCANPMCDALHQDLGAIKNCKNGPQQCDYKIRYLDGSGSVGVLLTDKFAFQTANGHNTGSDFAFGCGYKQVKEGHKQKVAVDGVLGLGRGSADFSRSSSARGSSQRT
ncbi:hypothetical protein QOZ80_9AG0670510 [Eleusine coracana subsp. coracana]|nr:hypothetical protein QOZ80_9AG0670510 [Eleusine coracana subsp. coracana]